MYIVYLSTYNTAHNTVQQVHRHWNLTTRSPHPSDSRCRKYAITLNKFNIPKVFISIMKTNILHLFRARSHVSAVASSRLQIKEHLTI